MPERGFRTSTTIGITHPTLAPAGIFEYQHSVGATLEESLRRGFEVWRQVDFETLVQAAGEKPGKLPALEWKFPGPDGGPEMRRRATLGPVEHRLQEPKVMDSFFYAAKPTEHRFCPCCFLTCSFPSTPELLRENRFVAVRFFAARGEQKAEPALDCRVNGEDWEEGKQALVRYRKPGRPRPSKRASSTWSFAPAIEGGRDVSATSQRVRAGARKNGNRQWDGP